MVPTRQAGSFYEARPLAGSLVIVGFPSRTTEPNPRGRVFRNATIRVFPEPVGPTSVCGTFGPLGPFRVRLSREWGEMDSEHEAQDELVEIGGRGYRVLPAAVFPIMSGREFDELVEDVRVIGLREPVVVTSGQLLDGRNRVRACAAAGVVPEVRELERGDPEEPGPECLESTPDPGAGTLFQGPRLSSVGTLWRRRTMSSSTWRRSSAVQPVRCRWSPRDRARDPSLGTLAAFSPFRVADKSSLSDPAVRPGNGTLVSRSGSETSST